MSINQLFFALAGLMGAGLGFIKYCVDAKIDPLYKIMERLDKRDETLNAYVIDHAERIAKLEKQ
jgi:hypothetical protein